MSGRREIEARIALYDELAGILRAMRSFALAELRAVLRRHEAQQQVVGTLRLALRDLASALPRPDVPTVDVWILLGSARGFCGGLNEDLVEHWRSQGGERCPAVAVGDRIVQLVQGAPNVSGVQGPVGALDAPEAMHRILSAVAAARARVGVDTGLVVCLRGEKAVQVERLLPLPPIAAADVHTPPLTNEPLPAVASAVAEQYLFHILLGLLLQAIQTENRLRLVQMEHALNYLEKGTEDLQRQQRRLRQEEIIEEIELLVRKREAAGGPAGFLV